MNMVEQRLTAEAIIQMGEGQTFNIHAGTDDDMKPIWEVVTFERATEAALHFRRKDKEGMYIVKRPEVFSRIRNTQ